MVRVLTIISRSSHNVLLIASQYKRVCQTYTFCLSFALPHGKATARPLSVHGEVNSPLQIGTETLPGTWGRFFVALATLTISFGNTVSGF